MPKPLIGFFGLKNSGKDEAAKALLAAGWDAEVFKFATPLKEMASCLMGVPVEYLNGDDEAARAFREKESRALIELTGGKIKTPRYLLQWLGTDAFRALHKDIWVKHLEYRLEKAGRTAFVTDCRFENEMGLIKDRRGLCIKIVREGQQEADGHVSEAMPFKDEDFDLIIKNDCDLHKYHHRVQDEIQNKVKSGDIEKHKDETWLEGYREHLSL